MYQVYWCVCTSTAKGLPGWPLTADLSDWDEYIGEKHICFVIVIHPDAVLRDHHYAISSPLPYLLTLVILHSIWLIHLLKFNGEIRSVCPNNICFDGGGMTPFPEHVVDDGSTALTLYGQSVTALALRWCGLLGGGVMASRMR